LEAGLVTKKNISLANLFKILCGGIIDKSARLSDWRVIPLEPKLIEYAAHDVWASLQCWRRIMDVRTNRLCASSSPPRKKQKKKQKESDVKEEEDDVIVISDDDDDVGADTMVELIREYRIKLGLDGQPVNTHTRDDFVYCEYIYVLMWICSAVKCPAS
jgi:hypothetical protein